MSFEPVSWLYGLLTRAVFGPPRGAADEEREWERAEPAALSAQLRALDARAASLEALIDPDGTTARPGAGYEPAAFLAVLARAARLADWLHAPAYDVAARARRLLWAAALPVNAAAAEDEEDALAAVALAKRRIEELEAVPRFKSALASAAADAAAAEAGWRARQIDLWRRLDREAAADAAAAAAAAPAGCGAPSCVGPRKSAPKPASAAGDLPAPAGPRGLAHAAAPAPARAPPLVLSPMQGQATFDARRMRRSLKRAGSPAL